MKIKQTENGDVKMKMSRDEFDVIRAVLQHVRLGYANESTRLVSDMAIAFEEEFGESDDWERVSFTAEISHRGGGCEIEVHDHPL